jgi:hypothetical protein
VALHLAHVRFERVVTRDRPLVRVGSRLGALGALGALERVRVRFAIVVPTARTFVELVVFLRDELGIAVPRVFSGERFVAITSVAVGRVLAGARALLVGPSGRSRRDPTFLASSHDRTS